MPELLSLADEPVVLEGEEARRRLEVLGIGRGRLDDALDAGDLAARQADQFSSVTAAGTLRWHETVRMLRQGLAADGWDLADVRNSPRVVSPTRRVAVVPVSGTADTGLADGSPRTARPRGPASSRAVQINGQLALDLTPWVADMAAETTDAVETWFLLYYRAQRDELRAELSLPVRVSDKGVVDSWHERVILPARTFDSVLDVPRDAGGGDDVAFDIAAR